MHGARYSSNKSSAMDDYNRCRSKKVYEQNWNGVPSGGCRAVRLFKMAAIRRSDAPGACSAAACVPTDGGGGRAGVLTPSLAPPRAPRAARSATCAAPRPSPFAAQQHNADPSVVKPPTAAVIVSALPHRGSLINMAYQITR